MGLFQKRNSRLAKWSRKPGEIEDDFSVFSTNHENDEKNRLIFESEQQGKAVSNFQLLCVLHQKYGQHSFLAGYFFPPLGEK